MPSILDKGLPGRAVTLARQLLYGLRRSIPELGFEHPLNKFKALIYIYGLTSMMRESERNMQQELMGIVKQGQIDQEAVRRLAAGMDSEFKSSPIRYFSARKVIIVAGTSELLSIRISGFGESFKGRQLTCSNIDNPENLEVIMAESGMISQSAKDSEVLYVNGGEVSITGPKYSDVTEDLDTSAEVLKILPRKDPDMVQIDNKAYRPNRDGVY